MHLVFLAHAVGDHLVGLAGEIQLVAVREVAAMRQVHAQDGVAGLQHGGIRGLIGLRARVRLHVGVLGAEQLLGAIAGQVLDDVGELAAAVVALAGIAFGVLVGEDAAGASRTASEVKFSLAISSSCESCRSSLVLDRLRKLGIDFGQRPRHLLLLGHTFVSRAPLAAPALSSCGDLCDSARVPAAAELGVQKSMINQARWLPRSRVNLRPERQHVGVVVLARQPHFVLDCARAARTPSILLAAIAMPIPVEQTRMPRSARPARLRRHAAGEIRIVA